MHLQLQYFDVIVWLTCQTQV